MSERFIRRTSTAVVLIVAAIVFLMGINWGLPSKAFDPYLFASRAWSARDIVENVPAWNAATTQASDVDITKLAVGVVPVVINDTPAKTAEIVRRYRLSSAQPDEVITFRALSLMNPSNGQIDPRFYQYGGLWVYPVGALLKLSSFFGMVQLRSDIAFYLDNPDAFGKFYVVARFYSAMWGLLGVWLIMRLARGCGAGTTGAIVAGLCFCFMPVVINAAHEAKPHLAGAVLMLLAVLAASKYVKTGSMRSMLIAAGVCGAAAGMVLTAAIILAILPLMLMYRPGLQFKTKLLWLAVTPTFALAIYFLVNPFVLINAFAQPALLTSNFQNTAEMYLNRSLVSGCVNAILLMLHGMSPLLLFGGTIAAIYLVVAPTPLKSASEKTVSQSDSLPTVGWLLAVPAIIVVVQLCILGAGKPGEFGRFALLPDIALALAAAVAMGRIANAKLQVAIGATIVIATSIFGFAYLRGFVRDASMGSRRLSVATQLADLRALGAKRLIVLSEPAPYCLPPMDFTAWEVVLLPRNWSIEQAAGIGDVVVRAVDASTVSEVSKGDFTRTPSVFEPRWNSTIISWADKPIEVWVSKELLPLTR